MASSAILHLFVAGMTIFLSVPVLTSMIHFRRLFLGAFARRHRMCGLAYLTWLVVGVANLASDSSSALVSMLHYDVVLGILGTTLALTAAFDFRRAHERVVNKASGTLDEEATVTFAEMIEHSFYQGLNLCQVLFLHTTASNWLPGAVWAQGVLLFLVTAPWLTRGYFPVNHFSDNYNRQKQDGNWGLTAALYRIKKWQYVFYKHALLHGLNIGAVLLMAEQKGTRTGGGVATSISFRMYWLGLNAAYTMEFFLQSLVRRRFMSQSAMLACNIFLMGVSSLGAVGVVWEAVDWTATVLSFAAMMWRRGHDVQHTMAIWGLLLLTRKFVV